MGKPTPFPSYKFFKHSGETESYTRTGYKKSKFICPRGKAWESPNHSQLMVACLWVPYAGQNRNLCNTKHGKGEFLYYWKYMLTG